MSKKFICILLMLLVVPLGLFGCRKEEKKPDRAIVKNGAVTIYALLPSNDNISIDTLSGIAFAESLADSVNLGENIAVNFTLSEYTDSSDVTSKAQNAVDNGASVIIYGGDDYNTFSAFTVFIDNSEIPVISISPYTYEADNFYSLALSPKYLSSCVATYAKENDYKNTAVIFESTGDYYIQFSEVFKKTFVSYVGAEPDVIFMLEDAGENTASYSDYDFIFLVTSDIHRENEVKKLRDNGFIGEIMLSEILDKTPVSNGIFNSCSFVSKYEADSTNNVASVFSSMYAQNMGIDESEIQPSSAYGYDAYMIAFEALKSFEPKGSSLFANNEATTQADTGVSEIMLSDLSEAIRNVNFMGVTDVISFKQNQVVPTYIYVDNIIGDTVLLGNKYTFTVNTDSAE